MNEKEKSMGGKQNKNKSSFNGGKMKKMFCSRETK
jgi:hypothetical protein